MAVHSLSTMCQELLCVGIRTELNKVPQGAYCVCVCVCVCKIMDK